jgi:hypothetical protein
VGYEPTGNHSIGSRMYARSSLPGGFEKRSMIENGTQKNFGDAPDDSERRAIDRNPLTQRLNRELLERNSNLKTKMHQSFYDDPASQKKCLERSSSIEQRCLERSTNVKA